MERDTMGFSYRTAVACVLVSTVAAFGGASAATGLSYGSVTKFSVSGGDPGAAPAPGTYRTDFLTATGPATPDDAPRGPFGLGKMLVKAQAAMAMLKNGTAEKHYVGTIKERVDNVALQTADITDCSARTITHLDLGKKTYSIISLDRPEPAARSGSDRRSEPGPTATDDGTKVALAVTTRALGAKTIEGVPTAGYDTDVKMTATIRTGETATTDMHVTAYYAAIDEPHVGCATHHLADVPPGGGASMANLALAMRALATRTAPTHASSSRARDRICRRTASPCGRTSS